MKLSKVFGFLGVCLLLGPVGGGYFVYKGMLPTSSSSSVRVVGRADREVKANQGSFSVHFQAQGEDVNKLSDSLKKQQDKVIGFLKSQGFSDQEIFTSENSHIQKNGTSYKVIKEVSILSPKVDSFMGLNERVLELVGQGVELVDLDHQVKYSFSGKEFDKMYQTLIHEATRHGEYQAHKIARDLDVPLGKVKFVSAPRFATLPKHHHHLYRNLHLELDFEFQIR